ncbi:restriction endonuclease subunit S [Luteimonas sp. XNQY3]|nr:restriction endonuclease subunit S [Luteimonas sp. XNQY3]
MSRSAVCQSVGIPWPTRPLTELAETFSDGDWIESKDQSPSGVRLVQTGNVGKGEFKDRGEKARFVSADTFARLNCTEVFAGDILVSRLPDPVGRACIVPESDTRMVTAVDCSVVRFDKRLILQEFFVYFTQSAAYLSAVAALCTGTTRSRISRSALGRIEIPLPNLDEQKRIVAVLDQAFVVLDRAHANAEASIADANALFDAELQRQFGAAGQRAGLLAFDFVCAPLTPRVKLKRQDYLDEGRYPVVSQEADLVSGYWNDPAAVIDVDGPAVVFGDHTCCLKYVDFDFVVGADGTKVLQPAKGISAKYLYYGLRSQPIQQTGYARHFKLLRGTVLPDLPTAEQDQITEHLEQLEARCRELGSSYETKLADIAALRQSFLQAAFSGQLS